MFKKIIPLKIFMKLKTIIKASDGQTSVSLTISSTHKNRKLTSWEQRRDHERIVNQANAVMLGKFNAREVKIS